MVALKTPKTVVDNNHDQPLKQKRILKLAPTQWLHATDRQNKITWKENDHHIMTITEYAIKIRKLTHWTLNLLCAGETWWPVFRTVTVRYIRTTKWSLGGFRNRHRSYIAGRRSLRDGTLLNSSERALVWGHDRPLASLTPAQRNEKNKKSFSVASGSFPKGNRVVTPQMPMWLKQNKMKQQDTYSTSWKGFLPKHDSEAQHLKFEAAGISFWLPHFTAVAPQIPVADARLLLLLLPGNSHMWCLNYAWWHDQRNPWTGEHWNT